MDFGSKYVLMRVGVRECRPSGGVHFLGTIRQFALLGRRLRVQYHNDSQGMLQQVQEISESALH